MTLDSTKKNKTVLTKGWHFSRHSLIKMSKNKSKSKRKYFLSIFNSYQMLIQATLSGGSKWDKMTKSILKMNK